MTLSLGRSPEVSTKGRQELIKSAPTPITSCLLPSSPSPDHPPFSPINLSKLWDSSAIYHVQFGGEFTDRKSTRLNSSHTVISYAVFCLKKKNKPKLSQTLNLQVTFPPTLTFII